MAECEYTVERIASPTGAYWRLYFAPAFHTSGMCYNRTLGEKLVREKPILEHFGMGAWSWDAGRDELYSYMDTFSEADVQQRIADAQAQVCNMMGWAMAQERLHVVLEAKR